MFSTKKVGFEHLTYQICFENFSHYFICHTTWFLAWCLFMYKFITMIRKKPQKCDSHLQHQRTKTLKVLKSDYPKIQSFAESVF